MWITHVRTWKRLDWINTFLSQFLDTSITHIDKRVVTAIWNQNKIINSLWIHMDSTMTWSPTKSINIHTISFACFHEIASDSKYIVLKSYETHWIWMHYVSIPKSNTIWYFKIAFQVVDSIILTFFVSTFQTINLISSISFHLSLFSFPFLLLSLCVYLWMMQHLFIYLRIWLWKAWKLQKKLCLCSNMVV
jgi:hypothetical protein